MWDTQISVLGGWPTVSGRFLQLLLRKTRRNRYFQQKQLEKIGDFLYQELSRDNARFL
jgi:hypothetical protein